MLPSCQNSTLSIIVIQARSKCFLDPNSILLLSTGNVANTEQVIMSSTQALPTVAIIAGAWQNAANYEPLRDALAKRGYESVCRSPPSTTLPHGDTDLEADIAFVHNEVFRPLVDQGKEVIILLHSFAGVYGASAVKGLSKSEVSEAGRPGGIIAIVYLAAPCIPSGVSLFQVMGIGPQLLPWVSLDVCTALIPCAIILLSV